MNKLNKNNYNDNTVDLSEEETRIIDENSVNTTLLESALLNENSYEDFEKKYSGNLGVGSFIAELRLLLFKKEFDISDMPKHSGISKSYFYQLANGTRTPSRDKIILVGFSVRASLDEVNVLLKSANKQTLYAKSKRDSIIIYSILHKYKIDDVNKLLIDHGHQILS